MTRKRKPLKPILYTEVRPMPEYIFRMPAGTPELTAAGLDKYLDYHQERKIGTTVTVTREQDAYLFRLYHLLVAVIQPDKVTFAYHGDRHQTTREWIAKIVADNGLGTNAWRPRAGYVKGTGSPLCIDGDPDKPIEGHAFTIPSAVPESRPTPAA